MRGSRENSGFVLLLVLLVLAVSGTVLAAAARRSGLEALRAHGAQRDLQLRWGTLSCRTTVLSDTRAEDLLWGQATPEEPIVMEARADVTLGGVRFVLIVGDELAKANANYLADIKGPAGLTIALRNMQMEDDATIGVELRPSSETVIEGDDWPIRYHSFDQLLELRSPEQLVGNVDGEGGSSLRRCLTCWGSGKLNVMRAEIPAMQAVLGDLLNDSQLTVVDGHRMVLAREALAANKTELKVPPFEIWRRMNLPEGLRSQLDSRSLGESDCHSLWVIVEDRTRNWYRFYVEQSAASAGAGGTQRNFAW